MELQLCFCVDALCLGLGHLESWNAFPEAFRVSLLAQRLQRPPYLHPKSMQDHGPNPLKMAPQAILSTYFYGPGGVQELLRRAAGPLQSRLVLRALEWSVRVFMLKRILDCHQHVINIYLYICTHI